MDEVPQAHEVASKSGVLALGHASYLSWIMFAAPLVVVFALSYLRFLMRLEPRVRWLVAVSACAYVGGAVGLEAVGAFLGRDPMTGQIQPGLPYLQYLLAASAEELMEMRGSVTFVYAIAVHLQRQRRFGACGGLSTAATPPTPRPRPAQRELPAAM